MKIAENPIARNKNQDHPVTLTAVLEVQMLSLQLSINN
jgi:hypothetical protein